MTSQILSTNKAPRIDIVDALRGFALAGVCVVHMIEQYMAGPPPEQMQAIAMVGFIDQFIMGLNVGFFMGKFYMLFSLLFGLSFFIQIDRPSREGRPYQTRFAWRLLLLFGFGFLHHFIYRGDILTTYAILGLLLIPLNRLPTKWLIAIAVVLFMGAGRYLSLIIFQGELPIGEMNLDNNSAETEQYFQILKSGSLMDVFTYNSIIGLENLINFQFGIFGRGYMTLGLFLIGISLGRIGFFKNLTEYKSLLKKVLKWSFGFTILSVILAAVMFTQAPENEQLKSWQGAVGFTFYDLANLFLATCYLCIFILMTLRVKESKLVTVFAPYGRMALTNYLLQSIIGTFIFYGWGLSQLGEWRNLVIVFIALFVLTAQILFSKYWMNNFQYGPLEWLWRSLTKGKIFAIRKNNLVNG